MKKQLAFDMLFSDDKSGSLATDQANHSTTEFPERFIADVVSFLDYCSSTQIYLTKTSNTLSRKHLQQLNEQLSVKAEYANAYSSQEFYPYIDFIFQLVLSGRMLEMSVIRSTYGLKTTERLTHFNQLTIPEKYCFLLETFWVDMDWDDLASSKMNSVATSHVVVFAALCNMEECNKWNSVNSKTTIGELLSVETRDWQHFFKYFEWFGLWNCQPDTNRIENHYRKGVFFAKNIVVTEFGAHIMPVLLFDRSLQVWNIALRKIYGNSNWLPGAPLEELFSYGLSKPNLEQLETTAVEDQSVQPFYLPFLPFFPEGSLDNTLPRLQQQCLEGAYTFKVQYERGVWRKLKLPGTYRMHDLHNEILTAYQYDDDHLYSFFMDGKKWSKHCIASPHDDFGHTSAAKVRIDSIGLLPNQPFLYVYDYGDEWTFTITLEEIDEQNTETFKPYLIESRGEGPNQYFFYEEEDDDGDC